MSDVLGDHEEDRSVTTGEDAPLAYKAWTIRVALLVSILTIGIAMAGGVAGQQAERLHLLEPLGDNARALVLGGILTLAYLVVLLAVAGAARRSGVPFSHSVGLKAVPVRSTIWVGLRVALLARLLAAAYGLLLALLGYQPPAALDPTELLPQGAVGVVMTLVVACLVGPFVEEVVFRGVLLSALHDRWGRGVAIAGSSVVFAWAHATPYAVPPIFILSVLIGRLFVDSRSLWGPVAAHSLFNGIGIVGIYALKWAGLA